MAVLAPCHEGVQSSKTSQNLALSHAPHGSWYYVIDTGRSFAYTVSPDHTPLSVSSEFDDPAGMISIGASRRYTSSRDNTMLSPYILENELEVLLLCASYITAKYLPTLSMVRNLQPLVPLEIRNQSFWILR